MRTNLSISLNPEVATKLQNYTIETNQKVSRAVEHILILFFGNDDLKQELKINEIQQKLQNKKLEINQLEQELTQKEKLKEKIEAEKKQINDNRDKWAVAMDKIRQERDEGKE